MRYLIIFALAYFTVKVVRNLLGQIKIVDRNNLKTKGQEVESNARLKVDDADIEDADFKEVEEEPPA